MKEQLLNVARKTRKAASTAGRVVTTDALPVTLAVSAGATGALMDTAPNSNWLPAALGVTLCLTGKSFVDRMERDKEKLRTGVTEGLRVGMIPPLVLFDSRDAAGRLPFSMPREGEPLYTSLDGTRVIDNPIELIDALGNPEDVAVRIGVSLQRTERGRPVTEDQVEFYRLVQAGLKLMPGMREVLCDTGQEMVDTMDRVVSDFERDHKPPQSSPTDNS